MKAVKRWPMQFHDLTGQRFGRLTVVGLSERGTRGSPQTKWHCRCDCGKDNLRVLYGSLTRGASQSCGCLRKERARRPNSVRKKHLREYNIWQGIKSRCFNATHPAAPNYGARGITVCPQWIDSFEQFIKDMGPAPKGYSIERKDVNGDYTPENCIWIPKPIQSLNRRSNIEVEWKGQKMILVDVARMENVEYLCLRSYMKRHNMPIGEAVACVRAPGNPYRERAKYKQLPA